MIDIDFRSFGLDDIQSENLKENLQQYLNHQTDSNFYALYNSFPHPIKRDVEQFEAALTPLPDIGVNYAPIDDILYSLICNYQRTPSKKLYWNTVDFLTKIIKYEDDVGVHTHKGAAYYNMGRYELKHAKFEDGLLKIHLSLKEDHLKHRGQDNFPRTPSFQLITLDRSLQDSAVLSIVRFIENQFLGSHSFDDFYSNFLDIPSTISSNYMEWLDHICFFTSRMYKLNRYFKIRSDYFNSTLGELTLASIIGDICLLIESTCKLKLRGSLSNNATLYNIYIKLCNDIYLWNTERGINADFEESQLENTLIHVLNNNYRSNDPIHNSFLLTYGLRNKVLHNINSLNLIRTKFVEIIKKQMEFFIDFVINH